MPNNFDQIASGASKDVQIAGMRIPTQYLLNPARPARSCPCACRSGRPPARPVHRWESGSSLRQGRNHRGGQSRRHQSRDPHTGVTRKLDLNRRRGRDAVARRRYNHPSKAIGRRSQIPPPPIDQARRHIALTRHLAHHGTGFKGRRDNRLLLLDAPPPPTLGTGQYFDACHCTDAYQPDQLRDCKTVLAGGLQNITVASSKPQVTACSPNSPA